MNAIASVVVPAHDEAMVLGRLLDGLLAGTQSGEFDVVVIANGCADGTADIARARGVRVIEIETASKIAALNVGDRATEVFPRLYVDADVRLSADAARAVVRALQPGSEVLVAAPRMLYDASSSSWAVRAHARIWALSDYTTSGHIGSGVYALSEEGRSRFGEFPDVVADDRWVQTRFAPSERTTVDDHFVVFAPRTLRAQVRRGTRAAIGNAQLDSAAAPTAVGRGRLVGRVIGKPVLWPDFIVYSLAFALVRVRARRALRSGRGVTWTRDMTSRT